MRRSSRDPDFFDDPRVSAASQGAKPGIVRAIIDRLHPRRVELTVKRGVRFPRKDYRPLTKEEVNGS